MARAQGPEGSESVLGACPWHIPAGPRVSASISQPSSWLLSAGPWGAPRVGATACCSASWMAFNPLTACSWHFLRTKCIYPRALPQKSSFMLRCRFSLPASRPLALTHRFASKKKLISVESPHRAVPRLVGTVLPGPRGWLLRTTTCRATFPPTVLVLQLCKSPDNPR